MSAHRPRRRGIGPGRAPGRLMVAVGLLGVGLCACSPATTASSNSSASTSTSLGNPATSSGSRTVTYAALGASETYGIGASPISKGYAYLLRDQLHLDADRFADVAIPGATLADAYQPELTSATAIRPTLCTVFFGVNDVRASIPLERYRADLTDLVATLRRAGARVLVIGMPALTELPALRSISPAALVSTTRLWNDAMRAVATANGASFLGLDSLSSELATHPEDIAVDGLHPSNAGHARLAQLVLSAFTAEGMIAA